MSVKFGIFTGPRLASTDPGNARYSWVSTAVSAFDAAGTDFNICLGDYFNTGLSDADQLISAGNLASIMGSVAAPYYCGLGEHTKVFPLSDLFLALNGVNSSQSCYSWDIGGVHFIIIPRWYRGLHLVGSVISDRNAEDWLKEDVYQNRDKRTVVFSTADLQIDRALAGILNRYAKTQLFIAGERRNDNEYTFFGIRTMILRDIEMAGNPYYIGEIDGDSFDLVGYGSPTRTFTFPPLPQRLEISSTLPGEMDTVNSDFDVVIKGMGFGDVAGTAFTISTLGVETSQTVLSWSDTEVRVRVNGLIDGIYDVKIVTLGGTEGYAYDVFQVKDPTINRSSVISEVYSRTEPSFCFALDIGIIGGDVYFLFSSFTTFKTYIYKLSSDLSSAVVVEEIPASNASVVFGSDRIYIVDRSGWNLFTYDGSSLSEVISTKPVGVGFASSVPRVIDDKPHIVDGDSGDIYSWDKLGSVWAVEQAGPGISVSTGIPCKTSGGLYLIGSSPIGSSSLYKWNGASWDNIPIGAVSWPGDLIENGNGLFLVGDCGVYLVDLATSAVTLVFPTYRCGYYGLPPKFIDSAFLVTGRKDLDRAHGTGSGVLSGHLIRFNGKDSFERFADCSQDIINGYTVASCKDASGNIYQLNLAYDRKGFTVNRVEISTYQVISSAFSLGNSSGIPSEEAFGIHTVDVVVRNAFQSLLQDDLDAVFFDADVFAVPIVVAYQDGTTDTVSGIFDEEGATIDTDGDIPIVSNEPQFEARERAFSQLPTNDATARIGGRVFRVREVLPDGTGAVTVKLLRD